MWVICGPDGIRTLFFHIFYANCGGKSAEFLGFQCGKCFKRMLECNNLLVPEGIIKFSKTSNTWFWMLKFVSDATFKYIFHF